jgi:hypothetical protein
MKNTLSLRFTIGLSALLIMVVGANSAFADTKAQKLCLSTTGVITARAKCPANQTALNAKNFGLALGQFGGLAAQGPQGPQGAPGPQGVAGPKGDAGKSALTPLAPFETVKGVVGFDTHVGNKNQTFWAYASLPIPAAKPFNDARVVVVPNEVVPEGAIALEDVQVASSACTGSFEFPTAQPGYVCIYPTAASNVKGIWGVATPQAAPNAIGTARYGFAVSTISIKAGDIFFEATYAYTQD